AEPPRPGQPVHGLPAAGGRAPAARGAGVSGRVLVVDDDRELCAWLDAGLGAHGFVTETHTEPSAALDWLRNADVDVVITDLNMRGMHGLELCTRVVESRPDVPVLVITAFGSLETAIGAIRAGAYDFLTKPVELEALVVAVERAGGPRRAAGEGRHPGGPLRFPHQAGRARGARRRGGARGGASAAARRGAAAAPRGRPRDGIRRLGRGEPRDGPGLRPAVARRGLGRVRPHHGGERDGQGAGGARPASTE